MRSRRQSAPDVDVTTDDNLEKALEILEGAIARPELHNPATLAQYVTAVCLARMVLYGRAKPSKR